MSTSRSLSDSSLQSWPTHPPQPTHVVTTDLHQHVVMWGWEPISICSRRTLLCGVEQESTKNPEQSSKSKRPKSEHIFSRNLSPKIWTRGRGPRALSHLISGAGHLDVKQTTESSSERKFTGAGTAWYGDTGYRPGVLIKISLCAVGWRKAASPYLELMNYSSGQQQEVSGPCQLVSTSSFWHPTKFLVSGFLMADQKPTWISMLLGWIIIIDTHVQAIASLNLNLKKTRKAFGTHLSLHIGFVFQLFLALIWIYFLGSIRHWPL